MSKAEKTPRIPVRQDPGRLSAAAMHVDVLLGSGGRLCKQFVNDERFTGPAYWIEPTGRKVDRDGAEELIAKGRLAAVSDGLFADASSQTFVRAA